MTRVIAGAYGGILLKNPPRKNIRPTSDRVKETMFNLFYIESHWKVMDLYAGSGGLGIEALSRGAREVTFVDSSYKAVDIIKNNLKKLKINNWKIVHGRIPECLSRIPGKFHLIFADPPYHREIGRNFFMIIHQKLSDDGLFILESAVTKERKPLLSDYHDDWEELKKREVGDTLVTIYQKRL
jgi:16S rRNA (guanine966-N2)-methyltransferase